MRKFLSQASIEGGLMCLPVLKFIQVSSSLLYLVFSQRRNQYVAHNENTLAHRL